MSRSKTLKLLAASSLLAAVLILVVSFLENNVFAYNAARLKQSTMPHRSSPTTGASPTPTQITLSKLPILPTFTTHSPQRVKPTQSITPTPRPGSTPTPSSSSGVTSTPTSVPGDPDSDRYFPAGTSVSTMISMASAISKQKVKQMIEREVSDHWSFIQNKLGFSTQEKALAFFLGMATRESTFNAGLETGSGPSHSYGALQAAETAYANANPSYTPELDVPQMYQYPFTQQNFYDAGIAIHMGIRHLMHFANQASAAGYTGAQLLRYALAGYNTGWVTNVSSNELTSYSDEIGALAGWYLNNGHLSDAAFTWTGDPRVDRSNPWGWY